MVLMVVLMNMFDVDCVVFGGLFWVCFFEIVFDVIFGLLEWVSVIRVLCLLLVVGIVVGDDVGVVGVGCVVFDLFFSLCVFDLLLDD